VTRKFVLLSLYCPCDCSLENRRKVFLYILPYVVILVIFL